MKGQHLLEQPNMFDKYFIQCHDTNILLILTSEKIIKLYNISYLSFCAPDNCLLLTQNGNTGFYNIQTKGLIQLPNEYQCVMKI